MRKGFKKLCALGLVFLLLLNGIIFVNAETTGDFELTVPTSTENNSIFKTVIKVKDISDLYSFQASLTFNKDLVQVVEVKGLGSFTNNFVDYKVTENSVDIVGTMAGDLAAATGEIAAVYFKALGTSGNAEFNLLGKTNWAKKDADITGNVYSLNKDISANTSLIMPVDDSNTVNTGNGTGLKDDIDKTLENISDNIEKSTTSAVSQLNCILDSADKMTDVQKAQTAQLTKELAEKLLSYEFGPNSAEKNTLDIGSEEILSKIKDAKNILTKAEEKGFINKQFTINYLIKKDGPLEVKMANNFFNDLKALNMNLTINVSQVYLTVPNDVFIAEDGTNLSLNISPKKEEVLSDGNSSYNPVSAYEFQVIKQKDGNREEYTGFKNDIELKFKAPGSDSWETMALYVFNERANKWEYIKKASWIKGENAFALTLNHFSKYALIEYTKEYSDISGIYDDAKKAIKSLTARNIINGSDNNLYNPEAGLTRAEMAKLMVETAQLDIKDYNGAFKDVNKDQWFAPYVEAAYKEGMLAGFGDGTFRPDELVTREQLAVAIFNMYQKMTGSNIKSADVFADDQQISDWAKDKVYTMRSLGLVKGKGDNTFSPLENVNRADTAMLFYNYLCTVFK